MKPEARASEIIVGAVLLGWSAVAALVVTWRPGANALDDWADSIVPASLHSTLLLRFTDLGTLPALGVLSVLAALVSLRRDRWRAVACLAGPLAAAVLAEYVSKPLVGRYYYGVLSFPSGSVAVVAAVATACSLAAGSRWRPVTEAVGACVVGLMGYTVIALRWHYRERRAGGRLHGHGNDAGS